MKLLTARHLWGIEQSWEESFPKIKAAGYGAIENPLPAPADADRFKNLLANFGFKYIAMVFTSGSTVEEHLDSFKTQIAASLSFNPILIISHTGQDSWDENQSQQFFEQALELETHLEIPVAHETHRGRILFNPWVTRRMLNRFPKLRLCADFSHWVVVCERMLDSEMDILKLCAARTIHVHARVGFEEGPQVPDPRAPEHLPRVEAHERWWDLIWAAQAERGQPVSTLTAEYGPADYMPALPYTKMPVANLWDISLWQIQREAARFAEKYAQ